MWKPQRVDSENTAGDLAAENREKDRLDLMGVSSINAC